jgi:transposase
VDISTIQEIKKLSENPNIGAYRVSAALEQIGIKLSRSTCGRYLSINRNLYHIQVPRTPRPKADMPFRSERRHQHWSVDIRYLDMHNLGGGMIYCISILENFSRAILASAISRKQDNVAFFAVLYDAVRRFGVPEVLVSDNGSIFTSHDTRWTCELLEPIKGVFPRMKKVWADQGYTGKGREWIVEQMGWEVEIVRHSWPARGKWVPHGDLSDLSTVWFSYERIKPEPKKFRGVLPRRWAAERTFAWIGRNRRMSKDYEYLMRSSEIMVCLTMIRLMLRRLAEATEGTREKLQRLRAA